LKILAEANLARATFATALLLVSLLPISYVHPQSDPAPETAEKSADIHIYATPDDSTPPIAALLAGESTTPLGESQGTGGIKWYLIKTKSGVVGWIKQGDSEQSKKVDSFFKSLPRETSATAVSLPSVSSAAAPRGAIMVPILMAGGSAIVSVTFNQTIRGNLMLDTGASNTVISRRLANLLSLRATGKQVFHTAGGLISVMLAPLQSLKVGDAEVNNLIVAVHDFSPNPRLEGLLGMDFLSRYQVGLDSQRQILVLAPR
jgi:predicted aspartyl protease